MYKKKRNKEQDSEKIRIKRGTEVKWNLERKKWVAGGL